MKAWIVSDIHLTRLPGMTLSPPFAVPDADICICAGDTAGEISTAIDYFLADVEPIMPVVMTLGNHEYVGLTIDKAIQRAKRRAAGSNIHILENETVELGGVRFIGATLWTDFEVEQGDGDELPPELRLQIAKQDIGNYIGDYTEIRSSTDHGMPLTPDETIDRHHVSRAYLERQLAIPFPGKTVVVSHHAPLPRSLDRRFAGNVSNAAYASDLSALIARGRPDYWMHGHVHQHADYLEGRTRVICNARGFSSDRRFDNGFDPGLVITI
jgi:Icc-related predicted phosphoesterase